ncbi:MAG: RdgB/HAM1 family non-canonical purine NTP pyrophosphatase [Bacteroidetes bacterium]|nr:RdgB/HAM1 family non-canonical purine NTP pyrophosphatase [Bacteroidota bacterium]
MNSIVLVTRSLGKFTEIRKLLPDSFILKSMDDIGCFDKIEETGSNFRENALIKAQFINDKYQLNSLADDSGLEVAVLGGAPGVFSARYSKEGSDTENVKKLLKEMENSTNRKARFKSVLALILDGKKYFFEGEVSGKIALKSSGSEGFGYDPVFIPDGFNHTFAELSPDLKNKISHRGAAMKQLVNFLNTL